MKHEPDHTPVDPLLARLDRLDRLQQRRPLPPPTGRTATPPSGRAPRTGKRHAAKGTRAAAVMMSIGATVGLSAYFQHADALTASASPIDTSTADAATVGATVLTPVSTSAAAMTTAAPAVAAETPATAASEPAATAPPTTAAPATTTAAPAAAVAAGPTFADGTYTGAESSNRWGVVQVEVTVSGGQVADVTALQTPGGKQKSVSINQRAVPVLRSEALTAQSASINSVSGATYTSVSYRASLQSAIDQAQQAALTAGATA